MIKKNIVIFNAFCFLFTNICFSFLYQQYLSVVALNQTKASNVLYFVKDNMFLILLFLIVIACLLSNIYFILDHWIYSETQAMRTKRIVGYTNRELMISYYFRYLFMFFIAFFIGLIPSVVILKYLNIFTIEAIGLAFAYLLLVTLVLLSILIVMIFRSIEKNKNGRDTFLKKVLLGLQLTMSFLLILVSFSIFSDIVRDVGPYQKYIKTPDLWQLNFLRTDFDQENSRPGNVAYWDKRQPSIESIKQTMEALPDNTLVFTQAGYTNKQLGKILIVSDSVLQFNSFDKSMYDGFATGNATPIIVSASVGKSLKVGDIIEAKEGGVDQTFVVAKILGEGEVMKLVGPAEYDAFDSSLFSIALYRQADFDKYSESSNFLQNINFKDIPKETMETIKAKIETPDFKYEIVSLNTVQEDYHKSKLTLVSGYLLTGGAILVFSIVGLIYMIYLEIDKKKMEISVLTLIGYTTHAILRKFMIPRIFIYGVSFIIACIIAYLSLGFFQSAYAYAGSLALALLVLIVYLAYRKIKANNAVVVIGGNNV